MPDNHPVFVVDDLRCAYNPEETVLYIPRLEIKPGQILIVLGKSGIGKSTMLETLGLMNNPIQSGQVLFRPPGTHVPIDLAEVWKNNHRDVLAELRLKHFSFIFQQTNLMPNFSVFENIYITRMIQGIDRNQCLQETREILHRLGMEEVDQKRKVTSLSGGQRQRVAFARAFVSAFDVLFGDEPTGNLDEVNARELLALLADFIRNHPAEKPKTAIIVTHSIDMAVDYADAIVTIHKQNGHGYMQPDSVFEKQLEGGEPSWTDGTTSLSSEEYKKRLKEEFSTQ